MFSALSVVSPPEVEPVTVDFLRRHARVDTLDDNDLLAFYLTTARVMVEQFLGRCLITQTLQWVWSQQQPAGQFPLYPFTAFILPQWMPYSLLFQRGVELPRAPVREVLSVSVGQWGQADKVLDPSLYDVDTEIEPGKLRIHFGNFGGFQHDHSLVTFVAGYGNAGTDVPTPICLAVLLIATNLYENRGDQPSELPDTAKALLWPFRLYDFAPS